MTKTPPSNAPDNKAACCGSHNVKTYGARGDGVALDSDAINWAIQIAANAGGGTVVIPAGDYLCYSIRLRSRVSLRLEAGSRLIAAEPPAEGCPGGYDAPEPGNPNLYQDFGHSRFRNSLIWGEDLDGVSLYGPGIIYGRGLSRGNGRIALPVGEVGPQPPGNLPDVLEADGPVLFPAQGLVPGPFGYPNDRDSLPAGVGNKAIALKNCRNIVLRDLVILHGGHFGVLAAGCDNLCCDNLMIDTNRDGIDIDACSNVRISNCSVNSPWDDGICIKSSCGFGGLRPVENVTISNCYVSGFVEGTLYDGSRSRAVPHRGGPIGRIKLGTEASGGFRNIAISNCVFEFCRGLALEQVDGSFMEDVSVTNLTMREVMNSPVFVRVGGRLRGPDAKHPGYTRRIRISNIVAHDVSPEQGIFLAGLPGHPVEDVRLSGMQLQFRGGGQASDALRTVPEMEKDYPEPMLFGRLPSWGIYVRHAEGVDLRDLVLEAASPEARPVVVLDNVRDSRLADIQVRGQGAAAWLEKDCSNLYLGKRDTGDDRQT